MTYDNRRSHTRRALMLSAIICAAMLCSLSPAVTTARAQQPGDKAGARDEPCHASPKLNLAKTVNEEQSTAVKMAGLDIELLDQDGKNIHFYEDLIKGKVVAINFLFTTCTTICPPLAATFGRIQKALPDRAGKDFYLISISVDPITDTPERMKAWGAKFGRRAGWTFVTGKKSEVDKLLKALNAYSARKEDHTPMVIIGNDGTGVWTRTYGLAHAGKLTAIIEQMLNRTFTESKEPEQK